MHPHAMITTLATLTLTRRQLTSPDFERRTRAALRALSFDPQAQALPDVICALIWRREDPEVGEAYRSSVVGGMLDPDDEVALGFLDGSLIVAGQIKAVLLTHRHAVHVAHGVRCIRVYGLDDLEVLEQAPAVTAFAARA